MIALFLCAAACLSAREDPAKELESKDAAARLAAVRALAQDVGHAEREKLLLSVLDDEDWQVVEEAATALGQGATERSLEPLIQLALEGPVRRVRRAAAAALATLDAEEAYAGLIKKLGGKLAASASEATLALAPALDGKVSIKLFEKPLKGKEAEARVAAARATIRLAGPERAARLTELTEGQDHELAAAALEAAALSADPACAPVLLGLLARPHLQSVTERRVYEAFRAIARAEGGDAALTPLPELVAAAAPAQSRPRAARLIGVLTEARGASGERALAPERALELLEPVFAAGEPAARAAAVWALGRAGSEEAFERAAALGRSDADAHVRAVALDVLLRGLGAEAPRTQELALERLGQDADAGVRELAAVALGAKGARQALPALVTALEDEEWTVGVAAAVSLGKTKQAEVGSALAALYAKSEDWRRRGAAIVGLSLLRNREGVPTVITALTDAEPLVQRTAYEYLVSLAGVRHERTPAVWEAWWAEKGERLRLEIPEEILERRKELGYAQDPSEVFKGLDVVVYEAPRAGGDRIEDVLAFVGIEHRLSGSGRVTADELHPDAVFVSNCTGELQEGDVERLAWFVRAGGYLFASCWAVEETVARIAPGFVRRLATKGEVLDDVVATPCRESAYLEGVFGADVRPIYALEGAYLIDVVDPERVEVLVDSPMCATRWGGGDLAAWFRVGHGVVLDSANHFEVQGLERGAGLKDGEERMAYAVDHMGLSYADLREVREEKFWERAQDAAEKIKDLSVFRLVMNFVRHKQTVEQ